MGDLVFGESFGNLAAHHVQGVAESLRQNQPCLRASARDQRVIPDGTGMKEQLRRAQQFVGIFQADILGGVVRSIERPLSKIRRRR